MANFLMTRRRYGTRRMLHEIVYKLAQRLMTLDVTHLMLLNREHLISSGVKLMDFTFRFLTPEEVTRFAEPQYDLTAELAGRVELGRDFCFGAFAGERLAAYAWYAIGSIEAEQNRGAAISTGVAMSFPRTMAFMYKGFTHPEFRGRGLYGYVNAAALEELHNRGVTTVISTADWTNWSALAACWRIGYQDLGLVWRGGWGRFMGTAAPRKGKSLGIQFGRRALVDLRTEQPATTGNRSLPPA